MAGTGDLELSGPFKKFEVPIDVWAGMSKERRDRQYNRFMKKVWNLDPRDVISSDGNQVVNGPGQNGGKKKNQRKRRRTAKTTSITKKKKIS